MPSSGRRRGILRISGSDMWASVGWKVLKYCTIGFTVLAFLGSFAAMRNGGVTFNGVLVEGWNGVWYTTGIAAITGFLFGCIWLLLFKAMSIISGGK